jgi:serine/threonine-protein kinase
VATRTWQQDNSVMVHVPSGAFWRGSTEGDGAAEGHERPQRLITLEGYIIDQHEVTNAQFAAFLNQSEEPIQETVWLDAPSKAIRIHLVQGTWLPDEGYEHHPVVEVTWHGANAYCRWAGKRLPTEAEWEKAARGLDKRVYPWGNEFDGNKLNFCDVNCEIEERRAANWDDGYARTAPVGSYPEGASPYGALDMAGSVWEWVADRYREDYYALSPAINPQGPIIGPERVHRGGAWDSNERYARTAMRNPARPSHHGPSLGFRCAYSGPEL